MSSLRQDDLTPGWSNDAIVVWTSSRHIVGYYEEIILMMNIYASVLEARKAAVKNKIISLSPGEASARAVTKGKLGVTVLAVRARRTSASFYIRSIRCMCTSIAPSLSHASLLPTPAPSSNRRHLNTLDRS